MGWFVRRLGGVGRSEESIGFAEGRWNFLLVAGS